MGASVAGEWGQNIVGVVVFCVRGGCLCSVLDPLSVNAVRLKSRHERIFHTNNIPRVLAPGPHASFDNAYDSSSCKAKCVGEIISKNRHAKGIHA